MRTNRGLRNIPLLKRVYVLFNTGLYLGIYEYQIRLRRYIIAIINSDIGIII